MKVLLGIPTLLLVIGLASIEGGLSSCTKDKTIYDTVTVNHHDTTTINHTDTLIVKDTVVLSDTFFTEAMLTAHPWKLREARGVIEGNPLYYLRGGSTNTQSFDNEYLTFNADHTGFLVDNALGTHAMTSWAFANTEHTKLVFTLSNYTTTYSDYTYDNIRFKDGNIHYDDYFHDNLTGYDVHAQEIRIPQ